MGSESSKKTRRATTWLTQVGLLVRGSGKELLSSIVLELTEVREGEGERGRERAREKGPEGWLMTRLRMFGFVFWLELGEGKGRDFFFGVELGEGGVGGEGGD